MSDFKWALSQLMAGNRVRATYWSSWALYLFAKPILRTDRNNDTRYIYVATSEGETLFWHSRPYDEHRAEWILVTDDMLPELLTMPGDEFNIKLHWYKRGGNPDLKV